MTVSKLPVLLCLHGGGTSADIFNVQARNLRSRLKRDFELIFVTAPHEGPAGPGVLPFFADAGPYYWWFSNHQEKNPNNGSQGSSSDPSLRNISDEIFKTAAMALSERGRGISDVVGLLGFSQGTLAASLFLSQSSRQYEKTEGRPRPFINLSFGVLICPGYRTDIAVTVQKHPVMLPTIHIHGKQDPLLGSGRALYKAYNSPELAACIEFDGSHHVPSQPEILDKITLQIREAYLASMQMKMGIPSVSKMNSVASYTLKAADIAVAPSVHQAAMAA